MSASKQFFLIDLTSRPDEQFLYLGRELVSEWAKAGVHILLTNSENLNIFRNAKTKTQWIAINYLAFNLNILKEMSSRGENPRNTKQYLWRAIKSLNLVPPSNFMEFISDEDVVEIYLLHEEIQVFRNAQFMEIVSHSLENILCLPWYSLGTRPWRSSLAMFRTIAKLKLGFIKDTIAWNVSEHIVKEKNSAENVCFSIQLKHFIPLKNQGKVVAGISTNQSRVISREKGKYRNA